MKQILGQAVVSTLLAGNPQATQHYTVQIVPAVGAGNYHFEPNQLTIRSGDTVTWINVQDNSHIIRAVRMPKDGVDFESSSLEKSGDKWSYTFKTSGTYIYNCYLHTSINPAVIIVDTASQPFEMQDAVRHSN